MITIRKTPCPNTLRGNFQAKEGVLNTYTVTVTDAGTYTLITDDGASGTITALRNGIAISLPITLVAGDLIDLSRSIITAAGWWQLNQ